MDSPSDSRHPEDLSATQQKLIRDQLSAHERDELAALIDGAIQKLGPSPEKPGASA
jgi:hypothetical protein